MLNYVKMVISQIFSGAEWYSNDWCREKQFHRDGNSRAGEKESESDSLGSRFLFEDLAEPRRMQRDRLWSALGVFSLREPFNWVRLLRFVLMYGMRDDARYCVHAISRTWCVDVCIACSENTKVWKIFERSPKGWDIKISFRYLVNIKIWKMSRKWGVENKRLNFSNIFYTAFRFLYHPYVWTVNS